MVAGALYAAEPVPNFSVPSVFVELLVNNCLQPHLEHNEAYMLLKVNKTFNEHIKRYGAERVALLAKPDSGLQKDQFIKLNNRMEIARDSIVFDPLGYIAYGINSNTISDGKPSFTYTTQSYPQMSFYSCALFLCCFTYPERKFIGQYQLHPAGRGLRYLVHKGKLHIGCVTLYNRELCGITFAYNAFGSFVQKKSSIIIQSILGDLFNDDLTLKQCDDGSIVCRERSIELNQFEIQEDDYRDLLIISPDGKAKNALGKELKWYPINWNAEF